MEYHRRYAEAEEQKMVLQTERLILRRMEQSDFGALCRVLQDEKAMYAYEHAFDDREVQEWLDRQIGRYQQYGFGLWAAVHKESGEIIGQCGLTMQDCGERQVLEIGYLFERVFWNQGYASEAAKACREYAFDVLGAEEVFSIIRDTNEASQRVARYNGMTVRGRLVKHNYGMDMPHLIFSVRRSERGNG